MNCQKKKGVSATFSPRQAFWFMVFVIWVAFALRVIRLNDLPLELSLDESTDGLDALRLVREGWLTPFLQNNFGRETLFLYIQGIACHIFGISAFALRFCSTVMGTLTVPLLFALGRQLTPRVTARTDTLFSTRAGLLAATGIAVCYWHIYFSRLALRAVVLPPLLIACAWCLWHGYRRMASSRARGLLWWGVAGALLGITLYTYTAARLLPSLFILLIGAWLIQRSSERRQIGLGLAVFLGVMVLVSVPLILYFVHYPQAFSTRAAAISLPVDSALPEALGMNMIRLLIIQFGGGSWVGHWPSLNALSGLGLLLGILVCVRHLRRTTAWWLLSWWMVGFLPTLLSRQDWEAVTTLLRGVVAWPALCLIAAVGLATAIDWGRQHFGPLYRQPRQLNRSWEMILPAIVLLCVSGATDVYHYFFTWASHFAPSGSHARVLADYLNKLVEQAVLIPNRFYTEAATRFLLQARYPNLDSVSYETANRLIAYHYTGGRTMLCIMPYEGSTPSAWTLLEPLIEGGGVAHLLPQLAPDQAEALVQAVRANKILLTLRDYRGTAIANVYALALPTSILPASTEALQPVQTYFASNLFLRGARVHPERAQPGESISLRLEWQNVHPIDGGYDLFVHLFNVQTGRRIAQVNHSLGSSILFHSHFWPPGLIVQEVHTFRLPQDTPDGVYRFEVGLYHRDSGQRLAVQTADGHPIPTDSVTLGKLLVRDQPPPDPMFALDALFEHDILLRGLDIHDKNADMLEITLHWQAADSLTHDYTVFTHLLDEQGNLVAQQDNMPQHGRYPTSWWSPGEIVLDPYSLGPLPKLPSGHYELRIGLYDLATGRRLRLLGHDKDYVEVVLQRSNEHFYPHFEDVQ